MAAMLTPANDNAEPIRMVPLIGEIRDDGFVRYDVVQLLAVPLSAFAQGGRFPADPREP